MDDDRYEFLNDRVDHCVTEHDSLVDRVSALEGHKVRSHGHRLEWIVIALVALEAAFEVLLYFHHA